MITYIGVIAALSAAFLWAASSTVYSLLGLKIPPLKLNLYKGLIAIALILITLVITNNLELAVEFSTLGWLIISGVIGIGLGDTAYFLALKHNGPRKTLLLETLSPPLAGGLAWLYLGETLTIRAWSGIILTVLGVCWVISEKTQDSYNPLQKPKLGIMWGILAAISQATAAVISRYALVESGIAPLNSTLIRLIGGTIIIVPLLLLFSPPRVNIKPETTTNQGKTFLILVATAFASTYLGIWLQQTALKYTPTGIATTLLATSPLFILPIAKIRGEKISFRAILGVLIALVGIANLG
ncbi:MAG: DMT family transporter [Gloeocapsa sp. DLM2.Bin57]|nr:MAG: DMT family transporter [Gloeocapsa sp. DLM2.Bin57]